MAAVETSGGQTAPKAKKLGKNLNERLAAEGAGGAGSDDIVDDDWMRKMEAEWQHANNINKLIAKEEQMKREARFAITAKGPILSMPQGGLSSGDQKMKTQDLG